MSINFSEIKCQGTTDKKLFGLCDDPPPAKNPAYIDENNGSKWIAVVVNEYRYDITFTAIDNCIKIIREDRKPAKRCNGVLSYNSTITFVELKERGAVGNEWVEDGEKQLRSTLSYFEKEDLAKNFTKKKAYIANNRHPKFKDSQTRRMNQFFEDTGYVLRIENRIILD
jgi:hypothetical protein